MKWEQKKYDKEVKLYLKLVFESVNQLNLLMPRLQKSLVNAVGYQLTLGSCIGKMKAELGSACELQRSAKAAAVATGKESAKALKKKMMPKVKMETDYSLLMTGQSPITDIKLEFGFEGDGEEGEGGDEVFKFETGKMSPAHKRLYTLFFDLSSPKNIINIFKTLALGLLGVIKNGGVMLAQMVNFVRKCFPPFTIITDVSKDIGMMIMALDFKLRHLPFKLAKGLRRILMLPRDIYRFCGSARMLVRLLASAMGKSTKELPAPAPIKFKELAEGSVSDMDDDEENELNAKDEPEPELPGELGEAAKEAKAAAAEADKMPDKPPPPEKGSALDEAMDEDEDDEEDKEDDYDEDEEPEEDEPDVELPDPEDEGILGGIDLGMKTPEPYTSTTAPEPQEIPLAERNV